MEITRIDCISCGVPFWVQVELNTQWKDSKKLFHCPNGHGQSYSKGTVEILRETIAAKDRELEAMIIALADANKPRRGRPRKT